MLYAFAIVVGAMCSAAFAALIVATWLAKDDANKPEQSNNKTP